MKEYLKTYTLKVRTLAPVFIGSGKTIGNFEYIIGGGSVFVIDMQKFMSEIIKKNKTESFQRFVIHRAMGSAANRKTLKDWCDAEGLTDYGKYSSYIIH